MMRQILFLFALCGLTSTAAAQPQIFEGGADSIYQTISASSNRETLTPTYLKDVYSIGGWGSNWFFTVQGGMNSFIGKPVGCGDLGNRIMPALNIAIGKWVNPYMGMRVTFLGFKMKNGMMEKVSFQNLHTDLMYNISTNFRGNQEEIPRWDAIPYLGVGMARLDSHRHPFALSYGLIGRYRLAKKLHLSAEIGGSSTFQDFDGIGNGSKFGDNIFHANLGLTITLGRAGWKSVVDAAPYITQNDILMNDLLTLENQNSILKKKLDWDKLALIELRKILEIEGLADKYEIMQAGQAWTSGNPKNNYSGLNSLRARLRNRNWNGDVKNYIPLYSNGNDSLTTEDNGEVDSINNGILQIGSPIYFFFKMGTDKFTDRSQVINAKAIAKVMKEHNLTARIIGSADAGTGTARFNNELSKARALYIQNLLVKYGVAIENTNVSSRGGIEDYQPNEANRNTVIRLFMK